MLPVIDHDLSEAWVFAHGLVLGLSRHKEVVEVIMKKGLLPYHIKELRALRTAKKFDWVCFIIFFLVHYYFMDVMWLFVYHILLQIIVNRLV